MKRFALVVALAVEVFSLTVAPRVAADPPILLESDKLIASDLGSSDYFGYAVDIDGDTLVVGSRFFDSAYIFERDPGDSNQWFEVKKLVAADGAENNDFGQAVAISGDTIIVGAATDNEGCSPDPCGAGAVYIYERNQGGMDNWGEIKKVRASDSSSNANFGRSVDLDGDTLAVGAPGDDENGLGFGSVYVLERSLVGTLWGETKKLRASDAEAGGEFGGSISLDQDTLLVGATGGSTRGAGYVFGRDRDGIENWGEIEKLVRASVDSMVDFGASVSINGDFAIVGAPSDDESCAVNNPGIDCNSGAAHLFERNTGGAENWGEVLKLTASDFSWGARFGNTVALAPGVVLVGAFLDNDEGVRSGSAYLFMQGLGGPSDWKETAKLQASDRDVDDQLGFVTASDGTTAVAGAPMSQVVCCNSGSAYVYDLPSSPPVIFEDDFESGQTSAWSMVVGKTL